jgi:muramoyltetrapeptide carboxypeptidase
MCQAISTLPRPCAALIAPGGKVSEKGFRKTISFLEEQGFCVRAPEGLIHPHHFSSNTDAERLAFLKDALDDPTIDILLPVRGGYGCTRLLPHMKNWEPPEHKKLFIGFSDNTALHIFFNQLWNWPTLHGPHLPGSITGYQSATSRDRTLAYMHENRNFFDIDPGEEFPYPLMPLNTPAKTLSPFRAKIVGGNLSIIAAGLGTFWQLDTTDHVLYLEDVNEPGYRLDRLFTQLYQAGLFEKLKALILGTFTHSNPNLRDADKATNALTESLNCPVFHFPESGHTKENWPFVLGKPLTFVSYG